MERQNVRYRLKGKKIDRSREGEREKEIERYIKIKIDR